MGIDDVRYDYEIKVVTTVKDKMDHHILILSDVNLDYLCSQYPINGMLFGESEHKSKFEVILSPNGDIPKAIGAASLDKKYTILLSAPAEDGKCSAEKIKEAIGKYNEIPILLRFNSMTVGYISLKLLESNEPQNKV